MWQRLMNWLPDLASGGIISIGDMLQVVGGFAGTLLALVALVYAWKVARDQDKIVNKQVSLMERQAEILGRMEALEGRQAEILKRQGEIAEIQHAAMVDSKYAQANVDLVCAMGESHRSYDVLMRNRSDLKIVGFNWNILLEGADDLGEYVTALEGPVEIRRIDIGIGKPSITFHSSRQVDLVPHEEVRVATLRFSNTAAMVLNECCTVDVDFGMFRKTFQTRNRLELPIPPT